MNKLINLASARGKHNSKDTIINSNENIVELTTELIAEKFANKSSWAKNSLTYYIKIVNPSTTNIEDITITDNLNNNLIYLLTDSIRINNIPAGYGFVSYDDGILMINLPVIKAKQTIIIEFKVNKKCNEVFKLDNYAVISCCNNRIKTNTVTVFGISNICNCEEIKNCLF